MNYGIIVSEFNEAIVEGLLKECIRGFEEQGIVPEVLRVPGAVEIPLAAQFYIQKNKPAAVVTLGCVIRGDTDHYEAVCHMASDGVMKVMLETETPIVFEILMVDDEKKALERLGKGYHAAYVATRMAELTQNKSK